MALPIFSPQDDPGPNFAALLARTGTTVVPSGGLPIDDRHATTVVALRFDGGVVMAGDRRATAGHEIAKRDTEKVFPADRHSAIAISGSAGFGSEMVRLFQVQLEHYEKVEGVALSLEGKANQLAQMVRAHLPLAFQGMVVVPLFCGYDQARGVGRIFDYDPTGGRYEEQEFSATGSGSRYATQTVKLGYREGQDEQSAVELAIEALFEAADADSATGGPDLVRGIFPIVAVVDELGYRQLPEAEVEQRFLALIERRRAERGGERA